MITFLPYSDFVKCVKVLDTKRLMKQRVEAYQIINILTGKTKSKAWVNHPAIKMWKGYVSLLKVYFNTIIDEVERRNYKNSLLRYSINQKIKYPWWIGYTPFHKSHQGSLLRKNYKHYSKYFHVSKKYLEYTYIWPSKIEQSKVSKIIKFINKEIKRNPYKIEQLTTKIS